MQELIKITEEQTMSSREIALLTGKQHSNVLVDIRTLVEQLGEEKGELKFQLSYYLSEQNKELPQYVLNKKEVLLLASGYNSVLRLKIINRLEELSKPKELSRLEILQIAIETEQKNLELTKQIEEQKPKVEFYDDIANTTDSFDMKEVSAMLKLDYGRNKLFKKLRDIKILMPDNLPYRKFIDNECFIVVETKWNNPKTQDVNATFQTRVTQKGLELLNKTLPKKLK